MESLQRGASVGRACAAQRGSLPCRPGAREPGARCGSPWARGACQVDGAPGGGRGGRARRHPGGRAGHRQDRAGHRARLVLPAVRGRAARAAPPRGPPRAVACALRDGVGANVLAFLHAVSASEARPPAGRQCGGQRACAPPHSRRRGRRRTPCGAQRRARGGTRRPARSAPPPRRSAGAPQRPARPGRPAGRPAPDRTQGRLPVRRPGGAPQAGCTAARGQQGRAGCCVGSCGLCGCGAERCEGCRPSNVQVVSACRHARRRRGSPHAVRAEALGARMRRRVAVRAVSCLALTRHPRAARRCAGGGRRGGRRRRPAQRGRARGRQARARGAARALPPTRRQPRHLHVRQVPRLAQAPGARARLAGAPSRRPRQAGRACDAGGQWRQPRAPRRSPQRTADPTATASASRTRPRAQEATDRRREAAQRGRAASAASGNERRGGPGGPARGRALPARPHRS